VVITTRGDVFALQFDDPIGVALALISTVIWALYWIANTRDPADPVVGLLLCFVCGLPGIVVANAVLSDFDLSDLRGLAGAVYIGVFEMGLAFVLWLLALKNAENTARVSNLIFIAPFISLYLIATVLGEAIHPSVFVGLVLILAGLIVQQLGKPALAAGA
jgi:drug/metabolite transporter (DMT)-like permease